MKSDPVANVLNQLRADPLISDDFKRGLDAADKTHREMAEFAKLISRPSRECGASPRRKGRKL
jgi:hypothetical protein